MGNKVGRLVSGHIDRVAGKQGGGPPKKPAPFSLRLGEREHARLAWLAERLGTPKTPLAEGLLNAALEEAVEQYAGWASPEDPQRLVREAGEARAPERPGGPEGGPKPPPPPHEGGHKGHKPPPPHEGGPKPHEGGPKPPPPHEGGGSGTAS